MNETDAIPPRRRDGFGVTDGTAVQVFEGDSFDSPQPTPERLALSELRWLTLCQPSKMLGLWNSFNALAPKNGWATRAELLYFPKAPSS